MSVRVPVRADPDVRTAFEDVVSELTELETLRAEVVTLRRELREVQDQLAQIPTNPNYTHFEGDVVIDGRLRVNGDIDVQGDVTMPGTLGGIVGTVPEGVGSTAQRVVQVNGSLAVLNGMQADSLYVRELIVVGSITTP